METCPLSRAFPRTYTYGSWTCAPELLDEAGRCFHYEPCQKADPSLCKHMYRAYGAGFRVTLSEESSSIVVRSEHLFSGAAHRRLSLRKHFYESEPSPKAPPLCRSGVGVNERFGGYLGFVDLRLHPEASLPIALGLLSPPRHLREDPWIILTTGAYGLYFGGQGFACTPYTTYDKATAGARCAQACMFMALVTLADRGATIRGTYTLTLLGRYEHSREKDKPPPGHSLKKPGSDEPLVEGFREGGLTLPSVRNVFRACRLQSAFVRLDRNLVRLFPVLMETYVTARCPIVLHVDPRPWAGLLDLQLRPDLPPIGHTVSVVGLRYDGASGKPSALIVHDPGFAPYVEVPIEGAFDAACGAGQSADFVVATDQALQCQPLDVMDKTQSVILRLRRRPDFQTRKSQKIVRVRLCRNDDMLRELFADLTREEPKRLAQQLRLLPRSRYWCVVTKPIVESDPTEEDIWLFDAERTGEPRPCLFIERKGGRTEIRYPLDSQPDTPEMRTAERESPPSASLPGKRLKLRASVITSASMMKLGGFIEEMHHCLGLRRYDLMILREVDIRQIPGIPPLQPFASSDQVTEIIGDTQNRDLIRNWLLDALRAVRGNRIPVQVSAFATYFPNLSSLWPEKRKEAIRAVVHTLGFGFALQDAGFMDEVIVEIVCGPRIERCPCDDCEKARMHSDEMKREDWVAVPSQDQKLEILQQSLAEIVHQAKEQYCHLEDRRFALGLELEPGEAYLLSTQDHLEKMAAWIRGNDAARGHVGFNCDIGHYKIAEIQPDFVATIKDLLVHAHIDDHPADHTCDMPLGSWTPITRRMEHGFYPYLKALAEAKAERAKGGLPISGAVALELEGCPRMEWITESIANLRYLIEDAPVGGWAATEKGGTEAGPRC